MSHQRDFILSIEDSIAVITLNRPKALNALNKKLLQELHHFFTSELASISCIGVVITGSGTKAFAAGADIKEFKTLLPVEMEALSAYGHTLMNAIEAAPVPVIAAIEGYALGGGFELALACHMRIGSDQTKLGNPEVNLGIIPGYGATQRLPQLIGKGRSLEVLCTARMIEAQEALEWGLLNKLVESGKTLETAKQTLTHIATKGPSAIQQIIRVVNSYYDTSKDGFQEEIKAFGELSGLEEFKEGTNAFIENRNANFRH